MQLSREPRGYAACGAISTMRSACSGAEIRSSSGMVRRTPTDSKRDSAGWVIPDRDESSAWGRPSARQWPRTPGPRRSPAPLPHRQDLYSAPPRNWLAGSSAEVPVATDRAATLGRVSADFSDFPRAALIDDEARDWYIGRRGGGHLLDAHLTAIIEGFGRDVGYTLRAPVDPLLGRPALLIIEVDRAMTDDLAWESLRAIETRLLEQRQHLSDRARRKDPFSNITVTLSASVADWEAVRQAIEDLQ
jgi:hypothetical protein